tara:strand:+ start:101 stop:316 length:216 start_codon:yes stop_codon:yes gene_type:complete
LGLAGQNETQISPIFTDHLDPEKGPGVQTSPGVFLKAEHADPLSNAEGDPASEFRIKRSKSSQHGLDFVDF